MWCMTFSQNIVFNVRCLSFFIVVTVCCLSFVVVCRCLSLFVVVFHLSVFVVCRCFICCCLSLFVFCCCLSFFVDCHCLTFGMLESSGFRKYSTLLLFQLFSWHLCLCHCLCNCLCFLFVFCPNLDSWNNELSENVWVEGSLTPRYGKSGFENENRLLVQEEGEGGGGGGKYQG